MWRIMLFISFSLSFIPFQFEKEFTDHQETQAQLQKKEAKINELQAELQAFKSQVKYHLGWIWFWNQSRETKVMLYLHNLKVFKLYFFLCISSVLFICISRLLYLYFKDILCYPFPSCVSRNMQAFTN